MRTDDVKFVEKIIKGLIDVGFNVIVEVNKTKITEKYVAKSGLSSTFEPEAKKIAEKIKKSKIVLSGYRKENGKTLFTYWIEIKFPKEEWKTSKLFKIGMEHIKESQLKKLLNLFQ